MEKKTLSVQKKLQNFQKCNFSYCKKDRIFRMKLHFFSTFQVIANSPDNNDLILTTTANFCTDCKQSEEKINNLEHKTKELQKALDESNNARYKLKKGHFNLSVRAENDVKRLKEENSKLQAELIKYQNMCSRFTA